MSLCLWFMGIVLGTRHPTRHQVGATPFRAGAAGLSRCICPTNCRGATVRRPGRRVNRGVLLQAPPGALIAVLLQTPSRGKTSAEGWHGYINQSRVVYYSVHCITPQYASDCIFHVATVEGVGETPPVATVRGIWIRFQGTGFRPPTPLEIQGGTRPSLGYVTCSTKETDCGRRA
jgi:hypothetical protein